MDRYTQQNNIKALWRKKQCNQNNLNPLSFSHGLFLQLLALIQNRKGTFQSDKRFIKINGVKIQSRIISDGVLTQHINNVSGWWREQDGQPLRCFYNAKAFIYCCPHPNWALCATMIKWKYAWGHVIPPVPFQTTLSGHIVHLVSQVLEFCAKLSIGGRKGRLHFFFHGVEERELVPTNAHCWRIWTPGGVEILAK